MSRCRYVLILFCAILSILLWQAHMAQAASRVSNEGKADQKMVIHSSTLEADDHKGIIIFTGDVEAKRDDFTVYCQTMTVYYEKSSGPKKTDEFAGRIDRIVAVGNVKIVRADGGVATSEKAEYYQADEKLVLTGNPRVTQNDNSVEGDRITLFMREDRSVVESASNKKVKAVIFPSKGKGNGP